MSTLRLYFDNDSADGDLVRAMRDQGVDCLTSAEAGRARAADEDQLRFATLQLRVVVTAMKLTSSG